MQLRYALLLIGVAAGARSCRILCFIRTVTANEFNGICFEGIKYIAIDIGIIIQEHNSLVPKFLTHLMSVETSKALCGLSSIDAAKDSVILIKQVVDTAVRKIWQGLRFGELLPWNDNRDERFAFNATDLDSVGFMIDEADGHSDGVDHGS